MCTRVIVATKSTLAHTPTSPAHTTHSVLGNTDNVQVSKKDLASASPLHSIGGVPWYPPPQEHCLVLRAQERSLEQRENTHPPTDTPDLLGRMVLRPCNLEWAWPGVKEANKKSTPNLAMAGQALGDQMSKASGGIIMGPKEK